MRSDASFYRMKQRSVLWWEIQITSKHLSCGGESTKISVTTNSPRWVKNHYLVSASFLRLRSRKSKVSVDIAPKCFLSEIREGLNINQRLAQIEGPKT